MTRSAHAQTHPDRNGGTDVAKTKFQAVNEAHEVLSDTEKRRKYDSTRAAAAGAGRQVGQEDGSGSGGDGGGGGAPLALEDAARPLSQLALKDGASSVNSDGGNDNALVDSKVVPTAAQGGYCKADSAVNACGRCPNNAESECGNPDAVGVFCMAGPDAQCRSAAAGSVPKSVEATIAAEEAEAASLKEKSDALESKVEKVEAEVDPGCGKLTKQSVQGKDGVPTKNAACCDNAACILLATGGCIPLTNAVDKESVCGAKPTPKPVSPGAVDAAASVKPGSVQARIAALNAGAAACSSIPGKAYTALSFKKPAEVARKCACSWKGNDTPAVDAPVAVCGKGERPDYCEVEGGKCVAKKGT